MPSLTFIVFCFGMVAWTLAPILLRNERLLSEVLRAEGLYRGLFENASVGIFQSTPAGDFTRINTAFSRIFGYPSPEALLAEGGRSTAWVYRNPEVRAGLFATLRDQGHFEEAEVETRSRDGSTTWVSVNANLVRMGAEEAVITGSMIDVTARHLEGEALVRARDEKALLLHELQHRVKNGMGVISSLVSLEAGRAKDASLGGVLLGLEAKVSALYSLLHRSGDAATIGLDEYLEDLVASFHSSHGHAERGIGVEDDGAGLPEGFSVAGSVGLGMAIVSTLAGPAGGASFSLDFPL